MWNKILPFSEANDIKDYLLVNVVKKGDGREAAWNSILIYKRVEIQFEVRISCSSAKICIENVGKYFLILG